MKFGKPMILSFSLLAFASASAYAAGDAKDKSASQTKPATSQSSSAGAAATMEDFSKLDKDGDGFLGHSEAAADPDAKSRFHALDKNNDEKLSQQEYDDWKKVAAGASGQSASAGASSGKSGNSQMRQGEARASELIGMDVTNAQGKDLGEIKDVVINLQGGKVHAAVLEFGGILGMGEKQYAFPISKLKPGKDDKVVLNVDKDKLKSAEGFAQNQWPAMNDEYWGRVGGQASAGGTKGQAQKMNLVRASEMIGKEVQSKNGKDIGEIKDMTVSLKDGSLRNIVLDVQDAGQAMVQAKSLSTGTGDKLVISLTEEQLRSQAKKSQSALSGGTGSAPSPKNK